MKYKICECSKFAFLMDAESVASLPDGYVGELCPSCKLWMCAIDKLPNTACGGLALPSEKLASLAQTATTETSRWQEELAKISADYLVGGAK